MDPSLPTTTENPPALRVVAGADCFGEQRSLGISAITFKVTPHDGHDLLIIENSFHAPGGPARHLHYEQDEWFYALEGEFRFEIGQEQFFLQPGDSVLAPRRVPHVWAFVGAARGRILITFMPAGQMEAFFRIVTQANAMPPQDPALWRAHGMELLGPPLPLKIRGCPPDPTRTQPPHMTLDRPGGLGYTQAMIVDCHAHVFPDAVRQERPRFQARDAWFADLYGAPERKLARAEDVLAAMDAAGVDRTVLLGFPLARSDHLRAPQRLSDRMCATLS